MKFSTGSGGDDLVFLFPGDQSFLYLLKEINGAVRAGENVVKECAGSGYLPALLPWQLGSAWTLMLLLPLTVFAVLLTLLLPGFGKSEMECSWFQVYATKVLRRSSAHNVANVAHAQIQSPQQDTPAGAALIDFGESSAPAAAQSSELSKTSKSS